MTSANRILAALLAVQAVLGVVAWWPRGDELREERNLLDVPVDQIERIAITGRNDGEKAPPPPVVLVKSADGWIIESADGYPAAQNLVDPLLENLGKLKAREVIASKSTSFPGLEVADEMFTRRIEVAGTDGEAHGVLVGAASGKEINARVAGDDEVYRVRGLTAFTIAEHANRYFERQLLKLEAASVSAIELRRPGQPPFVLEKGADGAWTAPGRVEPVVQSEAEAFVGSLGNVRMLEPVGKEKKPDMGFDQGTVVYLTITDEAGQTRSETYRLGAEIAGESGRVWFALDSSPFVFKAMKGSFQPALSQELTPLFQGGAAP